jgi:hypothetical protein
MDRITVRAVLFREGDVWVAQCLEYDFAAQAKTRKRLQQELQNAIRTQIQMSEESGNEPFAGFAPAPEKYWRMYEAGRALPRKIIDSAAREEDAGVPTLKLVEAPT